MKNNPKIWQKYLPIPELGGNKYTRGHAVVIGGAEHTGAAKLAATAALRIGAGLTTIICTKKPFPIYAASLLAVMVKVRGKDFNEFVDDERKNAFCIGPGAGVGADTRQLVLKLLKLNKNMVIDADAITSFKINPSKLFTAIKASKAVVVLTPHEGEFSRIFSYTGDRKDKAAKAAKESGAIVLLKGDKTIIASPEGRLVENDNAPPTLATAGTGDVLAGIITGLLAQKMPAFEAACFAAWAHGEAANNFMKRPNGKFGYGLISEDLLELIPQVLNQVYK